MRSAGVRASPMPPEQRREAVVAAALPLVRTHGADVTTKQIADAAGIAEGTLFRAFADKDSLLTAVVARAFDPSPTIDALQAIDPQLQLRGRLIRAVEIIAERLDTVFELMSALRMMGPPDRDHRFRAALPPHRVDDQLRTALVALLEPDAQSFRVDIGHAAHILRLITFACTHPRVTDDEPLSSAEIVDLLLDGLRAHAP